MQFGLIDLFEGFFFWKRKKNVHHAQSFKGRSSVKTEKLVFIKNQDDEGEEASKNLFVAAIATYEVQAAVQKKKAKPNILLDFPRI